MEPRPDLSERMHRSLPRPNLFIIGAMKSGTTSLHEYLSVHPDIFMSDPKEPGHFAKEMTYYPKDPEWYLGLFAGAGDARVIGESSTHYTKLPLYPGVAERILEFAPDARFVYLMRDPIRRAISHYWHAVRKFDETRPILRAIREDPQYLAFSDYRMQLAPYFRLFGRERVYVETFEALVADPRRVVREVLGWLGVSPEFTPEAFAKENAMPEEFLKSRGSGLVNRLRHNPVWSRLSPLVPKGMRELATRTLAVERVRPAPDADGPVVEYLRPRMAEQVAELGAWLGREFPEWTTVHGAPAPELRAAG